PVLQAGASFRQDLPSLRLPAPHVVLPSVKAAPYRPVIVSQATHFLQQEEKGLRRQDKASQWIEKEQNLLPGGLKHQTKSCDAFFFSLLARTFFSTFLVVPLFQLVAAHGPVLPQLNPLVLLIDPIHFPTTFLSSVQ